MRASIATLLLILATACNSFAQQATQTKDTPTFVKTPDYLKKIDMPVVYNNAVKKTSNNKPLIRALNKDTSNFAKSPLYLLKPFGEQQTMRTLPVLGFLKQEDIATLEILKDKIADSLYGAKGKYGVIIIGLTSVVKVYTIPEFLEHYQIKKQDLNLPLYLDNNILCNTTGMAITQGLTKTVTVAREKSTGKKYINIISTNFPDMNVPEKMSAPTQSQKGTGSQNN
jgi:hypothetical protein